MNKNEFIPQGSESVEKGKNVEIILKFIRHGERDKEGRLLDYGREVTKTKAAESGFNPDSFDLVKAIGSDAGKSAGLGMRSLETADIFARELAADEVGTPRVESVLNYEKLLTPAPYDHKAVYNAALPENYDLLSDAEKAEEAYKAQVVVLNHVISLNTPEAENYKKEVAGSFAHLIKHYREVARRLKSDSRALIPAGTHGGTMEFLLQQALVRKDKDGNKIIGFRDAQEIGGVFAPSDSYDVDLRTDEDGGDLPLQIFFAHPDRAIESNGPLYLDEDRLKELAEFYETMHGLQSKGETGNLS